MEKKGLVCAFCHYRVPEEPPPSSCPKCGVVPFHQLSYVARQKMLSSTFKSGKVLGDYLILKLVSKSSTSLYHAIKRSTNEEVALKVLPVDTGATSEQIERFLREASAIKNLPHPNIAPILESGKTGQYYFLAMKWLEGVPFAKYLESNPAHPNSLNLFKQILEAVEFVHQKGVLHRDLKPGNILVSFDGTQAYLIDFGLAKISPKSSEITVDGISMGTPHFMSPEQAHGLMQELDQRSDIYSLGAVLYQIITGIPPFLGASPLEVLVKVMQETPKTPCQRNPRIPAALEKICLKAMAPAREDRYSSVKEFRESLEAYQKQLKSPEQALRKKDRSWLFQGVLLTLLLCFLTSLVYFVVFHKKLLVLPTP